MPIPGIEQPEYILVDDMIRLRRYNGQHDFALKWYQDTETVKMVDGVETPYTAEILERMYSYLNLHGELYFIEIRIDGRYQPIGDVAFWQEDMPIVIGDHGCRGQGVGQRVIRSLVKRGRTLGYDILYVREIYDFNITSRKCFESVGFRAYEKTEKGSRYRMLL